MPENKLTVTNPSHPERNEDEGSPPPGSKYVYRGDDYYRKGDDLGLPLDGGEASEAEIQHPWEHIRDRETGQTTRFVSFSQRVGEVNSSYAGKFTESGQFVKVQVEDLRELEKNMQIRILTPGDVEAQMDGHAKKKIRKAAAEVRHMMERNEEILIEGQIPSQFLTQFTKAARWV